MNYSNLFTKIVFTGIFLTSLFSCKKDDVTEPENGDNHSKPSKVSAYINSRKAPTQKFTVSTSSSKVITTDAGTSITLPANAFADMEGNLISGDVEFEVIEIFKKSDMMKSNKPTTSDGKVLISGGAFYFMAQTSAGAPLQLADGSELSVQTPDNSFTATDMALFIGGEDDNDQFNWEVLVGDSARLINQSSYFFDVDTLGWINIDKFYNATTTTLTINLGESATTSKALTFIVFNDINSVLSPSTYYGTINEHSYEQGLIPVGESITVICLAEVDNKLQLANTTLTVTENATVNLVFEELTESEIDDFLASFDD